MSDWAIVVPSNRPERLAVFLRTWEANFRACEHDVAFVIVEDAPPWPGIPSWIPRRTDMIRSWGFYQAWKAGHKRIVSLDDDVLPRRCSWHGETADLLGAYAEGFATRWPVSPYLSTGALTGTGLQMRGFPVEGRGRRAAIQYGGWDGVPDLDGETQLTYPDTRGWFQPVQIAVPRGSALTTCAMNFCFEREFAPWCWQLPILEVPGDRRYDRFGDIWSGLAQKRLCDTHDVAMVLNGTAAVYHDRASNPTANALKEQPGRGPHEGLWEYLRDYASPLEPYAVFGLLITWVGRFDPEWREHALHARDAWFELFEGPTG